MTLKGLTVFLFYFYHMEKPLVWILETWSKNRCENDHFGLKLGKDLENWMVHSQQDYYFA